MREIERGEGGGGGRGDENTVVGARVSTKTLMLE